MEIPVLALKKRKLGSTGIELTEYTLGTWGLFAESYGPVFPEQKTRTLQMAIEQGVRAFDMAPVWGQDGESERAVREAVGSRRDEMVYITRAGLVPGEFGFKTDFSAEGLRAQCEASLARLGTDRIDVWLLHNAHEADLRSEEAKETAEALVREGKVRAWGASVAHIDDARAALEAGAQVLCVPFHMLSPRLVWDLEPDLRARGVGLLARSVLCHGLLSGRWTSHKRFAPDDHRSGRWSPEALGARIDQVEARRFLLHGPVLTMAQAAHRFVLAHDVVSSVIVGSRSPGQVEASVMPNVTEPYLPEADLERLRRMSE
jgi:aryl-alcohol dehydrogenase-like predicted oxidoreductase